MKEVIVLSSLRTYCPMKLREEVVWFNINIVQSADAVQMCVVNWLRHCSVSDFPHLSFILSAEVIFCSMKNPYLSRNRFIMFGV